ncbi:uncharacterized protein PGTG_22411 [Puccinia graminis f. sp. tritici CRL 75-36-700-3]|uniref:Uncharacterized protein n=1 Tax=Puccinia graminis f. sp. tritici (strain CRL 75-36-700-3 / race SCCL) TaxID=418459 RepID=H6QUH6_PUCGT|nr:uncharacterized protein PGTG_22411 [Puccinia graminis f. sp. tritici CRL 75-36-700-3]EHS64688.1 hypothetical protein PGTG_22411 [Puccinia graminis f. sp. tritici CRL 75-36-700-3]
MDSSPEDLTGPKPEGLTSPEEPNLASDLDNLRSRYAGLHPLVQDNQNSFSRLLRESSRRKVEQYLDDLAEAFARLEVPLETRNKLWRNFLYRDQHIRGTLIIVCGSDDNLKAEFVRLAFFHQHPEFAGAERPISPERMLVALAAPSRAEAETLIRAGRLPASDDLDDIAILKEGYKHEYLRSETIVRPILKKLSDNAKDWRPSKYVAPYTTLIGPSMSGKTRLLMKLSENICVVYICLRERNSCREQPPRSVLADEMQLPAKKAHGLEIHYSRLLAAIFDVVADFFSDPSLGIDEKARLSAWYSYNHNCGDDLAARVRDTMKGIGQNIYAASVAFTTKLEKLETNLGFISNQDLKVLLAFDEARALVEQETCEDESLPYFHVLRRVLSKIPPKLQFFAIFANTTLDVANFSPSSLYNNDPSGRPLPDSKEVYAPIYAIGTFDSKVPSCPPKTWDELLSPRRLFSYGSPFFRIYFEEAEKPERAMPTGQIVQEVTKIATDKLLCFPRLSEDLSEAQILALLGCTIQPQIHKAAKLNSELVSSHLAQCLYISPMRERWVSEYPSQFTLSMAANTFLTKTDSRLVSCIKVLTNFVQEGLISSENSGQLVSRIILLRAMQKAMWTSPIRTKQTDIPYGCSVRLVDFLKALIGEESELKLDMDGDQQTRLLKEGRIFWNHFTHISYTPHPAHFLKFLYRGLAVQCKPDQRGFDQMFPIYLAPELSEFTLDEDRISFCGVQAKNDSVKFQEEGPKWNSKYARVGLKDDIPYLFILFSFRTTRTKYTLPTIPQRGSLIFHGLDQIKCLTPEISSALKELLSVVTDIRDFDKDNKDIRRFVENTRPCAYRHDDREVDWNCDSDDGIDIDQGPENETHHHEE